LRDEVASSGDRRTGPPRRNQATIPPDRVEGAEVRTNTHAVQSNRNTGFSMIELLIVLLLGGIMAGYAVLNLTGVQPGMRADAAMNLTLAQMRRGRELAMAQRRNVEIQFLGNNEIRLQRDEVPTGTTILSTVPLENNIEFHLFGDMGDTPDGFGSNTAVDFGGATRLIFLTDGTLVDGQANPLNGTVFLGMTGHPESARAVTLLGATGRVRNYRWTGNAWIH
jgi:prepilin-type N-terminal cleavage/methylation domain-containing protein